MHKMNTFLRNLSKTEKQKTQIWILETSIDRILLSLFSRSLTEITRAFDPVGTKSRLMCLICRANVVYFNRIPTTTLERLLITGISRASINKRF